MKFEYYLGILPEEREEFERHVEHLNELGDWKYAIKVLSEFDDPDGYYTFQIEGTPDSYRYFLRLATNEGFVKSLNHYEV